MYVSKRHQRGAICEGWALVGGCTVRMWIVRWMFGRSNKSEYIRYRTSKYAMREKP